MTEEKIKKKRKKGKKKKTNKPKLPFYKKWWFIFACGVIVGALFSPGSNKNKEVVQSSSDVKESREIKEVITTDSSSSETYTKSTKESKKEQTVDTTKETAKKSEALNSRYDDINFGEVSIINIETIVENEELTLKFKWRNDSLEGKKSLIQAGILIDVYQNDDIIEEKDNLFGTVGGNVSYQAKKGIETPIVAKYKLKTIDKPVEISFSTTNKYDEKKTIEVKL